MSHAKSLIAASMLIVSAASAMAAPAVTGGKVNLRAGPGPAFGIIAVLPPGTKLDVQKCGEEWCRVKLGRQVGYASAVLLKTGGNSYASVAPQPAPVPVEPKATQSGPHIWQWNNDDWRDDHWRRLEWHNRMGQR